MLSLFWLLSHQPNSIQSEYFYSHLSIIFYLLMYQIPYSKKLWRIWWITKLFVNIQNFHNITYGLTNACYPSMLGRILSLPLLIPQLMYIWSHIWPLIYGNSFLLAIWLKWYCRSWCKIRKISWNYEGKMFTWALP